MWGTNCSGLPPTPTPWTPLFIRLPRMADTKSPLNLNLYETTTPTRTDLCRNTLLIIISRLSFYFNFAAPPLLLWAVGKVRFLVCGKRRYNKFIVGTHTHTPDNIFVWILSLCRVLLLLLSLMHSYSIGSTPRSGHNVRSITCCSFDYVAATRWDALPAPLSYPSSRASLTRSCVTFIGHVVALWPFGIAARTAAAAEWSLVCLFVCFAVRLPSPSPSHPFPAVAI